jgi:hypothetical protein
MKPRFSLLTLLVVILAVGSIVGLYGRYYFRSYVGCEMRHASDGIRAYRAILISPLHREGQYVVIDPLRVRAHATNRPGEEPHKGSRLSLHPEGVFYDGERVELDNDVCFLVTNEGVRPIPVTESDQEIIAHGRLDEFFKSPTFKNLLRKLD